MQDIAFSTVKALGIGSPAAVPGTGIEPQYRAVTPARPRVARPRLPYHVTGASAARLPASHARAAANQRRAGVRGGASAGATAHAPCPGRLRSLPRGRVEAGGGAGCGCCDGGGGCDGSREPGRERAVSATAGGGSAEPPQRRSLLNGGPAAPLSPQLPASGPCRGSGWPGRREAAPGAP